MKNIAYTLLVLILLLLPVENAFARGARSSRVSYGGGHHTTSHGGHYSGSSSGSSHKGGTYKNSKTGNHYGTHK